MSSLRIQKAEAHAIYRCMAYNKVGEDSRVIFFHVTRKAGVLPPSALLYVRLGLTPDVLFSSCLSQAVWR